MKNNQITIRLNDDLLKALKKRAKTADAPMTFIVRIAIRYYLENMKDLAPKQ